MPYNFNEHDEPLTDDDYLQEYFDDISEHIKSPKTDTGTDGRKSIRMKDKESRKKTGKKEKKERKEENEKNRINIISAKNRNSRQKTSQEERKKEKNIRKMIKEHRTSEDVKELILNIDKYIAPILISAILYIFVLITFFTLSFETLLLGITAFTVLMIIAPVSVHIIDSNPMTDSHFRKVLLESLNSLMKNTSGSSKIGFIVRIILGYIALSLIFLLWIVLDVPIINIVKIPVLAVCYILYSYIVNSAAVIVYSIIAGIKDYKGILSNNLILYLIPGMIFVAPTLNIISYKNIFSGS